MQIGVLPPTFKDIRIIIVVASTSEATILARLTDHATAKPTPGFGFARATAKRLLRHSSGVLARCGVRLPQVALQQDLILLEAGKFDQAQAGFLRWLTGDSGSLTTLSAFAKNAAKASEHGLASQRWLALCAAFPEQESCHRQAILSLLKEQEIQAGEHLFQAGCSRFSSPSFLAIEAQILEAQECFGEALSIWKQLAQAQPHSLDFQLNIARALSNLGRHGEVETQLLAMSEQCAGANASKDIAEALATNATLSRNFRRARTRWQALVQAHPDIARYHAKYLDALLSDMDIPAVQRHLKAVCQRWPDSKIAVNGRIKMTLIDNQVEQALDEVDRHVKQAQLARRPVQFLAYLKKIKANLLKRQYQNTGDRAFLAQSLHELRQARALKHSDLALDILCLTATLALDRAEEAKAQQRRLPESLHPSLAELETWALAQDRDLEGARALWRQRKQRHYIPIIAPYDEPLLERKDALAMALKVDEIQLFTAIRNEAWRLPWFLDYYRGIGVDRFFFVDNGSNDGSLDYLLQQPDVHVFWTAQSYAAAYSGMQWINHLVQRYGRDAWVIYADVDEALVYPGVESRGLRSLTDYMTRHDQEALPGFMLDMFSDAPAPSSETGEPNDFVADYPLFDPSITRNTIPHCPYTYVRGGARQAFGWGEILTKVPLIRGGRDIDFLMSSHRISPARLSDVSAVLLHYKLAGDYRRRFDEDLTNNHRIPLCQQRHRHYQRFLQRQAGAALPNSQALRYAGSGQLQDLGLLHAPARFLAS